MTSEDRGQRDAHRAGLAPVPSVPLTARRGTWDARRARLLTTAAAAADVAEVVLLDVEPAVEAQRVGVHLEEALRVRVAGKLLEPLLLEVAEVLRAHLRPLLELLELEVLADARLAETGADLEHESGSLVASAAADG